MGKSYVFTRFGIASTILLMTACGPKKDDEADSTERTTNPGVTENAANSLVIAGQLALSTSLKGQTTLTASTKGVVLFTLDYKSQLAESPIEIEVAADGSFEVPIVRNRLEEIKSLIVNGVVNRAATKEFFPQYAAEIDKMSDAEISDGLSDLIADLEKNPDMRYVLVSYDKSGNSEMEATSMQFIGLPTNANSSLKLLPGESLKGDLNLGSITGSGDEATSTLPADESLNLSASVIEELAGASETLKFLKNTWMNPDEIAEVTPWFGYVNTNVASTVNSFTTPNGIVFGGGGYYIKPSSIGATWGEVCPPNPANTSDKSGVAYSATPAKILKWVPPIDIASTETSATYGPNNPYTNAGGSYKRADQYGETSCSKETSVGGGMYTRAKSESDTGFQLQLGEYIKGKTPEGLWRLKLNDVEKGRWDLSAAAPYDADGNPLIYIPAIKAITNSSNIMTGFQAKYYFYDKATKTFREVTDVAGVTKLVHSFNLDGSYSQSRSGGDLSVKDIGIGTDGIVVVTLAEADRAVYPCPDDSTSVQCITKLGFSYFIGSISYRMSIDKNGSK